MDTRDIMNAHGGDPRARRALHEALLPVIHRAVARRVYPIARASGRDPRTELEDLVHGAWVKLFEHDWRALRRYEPERGSLESYVALIADRHVLSTFRVKSKDPYHEVPVIGAGDLDPDTVDVEEQAWARAELAELERHIHAKKGDRGLLLFRMLMIDQLPIEDVAERAELSKAAAYQWRARLKALIATWRRGRV